MMSMYCRLERSFSTDEAILTSKRNPGSRRRPNLPLTRNVTSFVYHPATANQSYADPGAVRWYYGVLAGRR
jgi:hypothetical protein